MKLELKLSRLTDSKEIKFSKQLLRIFQTNKLSILFEILRNLIY